MAYLLTEDAWPRIRAFAQKRGPRLVAVPFVGTGAPSRLPLRSGDLLITRLDEPAVRAGLTNPTEIARLIRRGVEVHHVANLHAKVFVLGGVAVVGSTNVSHSSESQLLEAALLTDHRSTVHACAKFVRSLRGDLIGLAFANRL